MLDQFGHRLVERGYDIIPILPGKKRPPGNDWQKIQSTPELVTSWIDQMPQFGIGVLASTTCAVDIDCRDKAVNNKLLHWLKNNVGWLPSESARTLSALCRSRTSNGSRR